jgi:Raf kinase inhibitor-like YbhB/YbcL family protein
MSPRGLRHVRRSSVAIIAIAAFLEGGCNSGQSATAPPPTSTPIVTAAGPGTSASPVANGSSPSAEVSVMTSPTASDARMTLTSSAFANGDPIPAKYSCHGEDISPPLAWAGVPTGAKALVLFVDDPDGRDWVHWSVLDVPAEDGRSPEGVAPGASSPQQGTNDFRKVGYGGPCPPSGTHHYRFTLYALAAPVGLSGHPDGKAVRAALEAADVLAQARLTGTFKA